MIMQQFIEELGWDSNFFGYRVGKTNITADIYDKINYVKDEINNKNIKLLYHIQEPNEILDNYELQKQGFYITDNKVTLHSKISLKDIELYNTESIKDITECNFNIQELYEISKQISLVSRYAYDPNILKEKVEELYKLWIYNGINKGFCDKTFIYKVNGKIAGLVMLKLDKEKKLGDISLIGVNEKFRKNGIGTKLIMSIKKYLYEIDYYDVSVSTQFRNFNALNLYIKNGFKIYDCKVVYHYWNNI